jgi:hypothetical protein
MGPRSSRCEGGEGGRVWAGGGGGGGGLQREEGLQCLTPRGGGDSRALCAAPVAYSSLLCPALLSTAAPLLGVLSSAAGAACLAAGREGAGQALRPHRQGSAACHDPAQAAGAGAGVQRKGGCSEVWGVWARIMDSSNQWLPRVLPPPTVTELSIHSQQPLLDVVFTCTRVTWPPTLPGPPPPGVCAFDPRPAPPPPPPHPPQDPSQVAPLEVFDLRPGGGAERVAAELRRRSEAAAARAAGRHYDGAGRVAARGGRTGQGARAHMPAADQAHESGCL